MRRFCNHAGEVQYWHDAGSDEMKPVCPKCNGTRRVKYWHDAGDHFSGGSPLSEWEYEDCPNCKIVGVMK